MRKTTVLSSALLALISLISAAGVADTTILPAQQPGHPDPFTTEMLSKKIELKCPLAITEWRGSEINMDVVADMSELCRYSFEMFPLFMRQKGYGCGSSLTRPFPCDTDHLTRLSVRRGGGSGSGSSPSA